MSVKVSICIPAYNNPSYIKRALESVFMQTYLDFEVVITDDSSDSSVSDVVRSFPQNKIVYQKNAGALGTPENWNEAIRLAKGEYIKILHHDDWFSYEDSLYRFVRLLDENQQSDLAFSGSLEVSAKGSEKRSISKEQAEAIERDPKSLFTGNHIGSPSATIYRRNNMKFDKNLKWLVDLEFYIRMLQTGRKFIYSMDPMISIGISGTQVTNSFLKDKRAVESEYLYVYKKLDLRTNEMCRKYMSNLLSMREPGLVLRILRNVKSLFAGVRQ